MEGVSAALGLHLDLHRTLRGILGGIGGGRDAELFDGINAGPRDGEESVIGLEEIVLGVDSIVGNVNRPLGQAIERCLARASSARCAGRQRRQVKCAAGGEG